MFMLIFKPEIMTPFWWGGSQSQAGVNSPADMHFIKLFSFVPKSLHQRKWLEPTI